MAWRLVVGVLGAAALSGLMVLLIFPSGEWQESEAASQKLLAIRPVKGLHFPGATLNAPQLVGYGIGDWQQLLSSGNLDAMLKESNYRPGKLITPALKQVAALDLVQAGSYEARGFSFRVRNAPGGVEVIWLKSAPGGVDLIFTPQSQGFYESAGLKDGTLYTVPGFLEALRAFEAKFQQSRQADANKRSALIDENKRKAAGGFDTSTTRLRNLQTSLEKALAAIKPAPTGYFEQPIADLIRAQADVSQGLAYLKSHPGEDSLLPSERDEPIRNFHNIGGVPTLGLPKTNTVSDLESAEGALRSGLADFLGNPNIGQPIMGEMGGNRDTILRDVAVAKANLEIGAKNYLAVAYPSGRSSIPVGGLALVVNSDSTAPTGSISGTVLLADGTPSAFTCINFKAVAADGTPDPAMGNATIPSTLSDKNGQFTIKNLLPGFYTLPVGSARGVTTLIGVKAGAETKLPMPLTFTPATFVGGG